MELTTSYQLISSFNLTYGAIRTYAKYSSQSSTDNTTTYQIKQVYYCSVSGGYTAFDYATAVLDGTQKIYNGYTRMYSGETTIQELNRVIEHNPDGSSPIRTIATSWTASFGGNGATSVDITFPNIARYPILTNATDFNDEQNPTIYFTNVLGMPGATVRTILVDSDTGYQLPGINWEYINDVTPGYFTYNLTNTERNTLRTWCNTSNSKRIGFTLLTEYNGNQYWSPTIYKTLTIVNANPTFTASYLDTNNSTTTITGDNQKIIQNKSTLRVNIASATAKKQATLTNVKVTINGVTTTKTISSSTLAIDIGTVNLSDNTSIPVVLTDSRGNTSQVNLNLQVLPYQLPNAIIDLKRKQNYYTETDITPDASYSSLDGNNTLTIQYRIKKTSEESYGAYSNLTNYTTTTFNADNLYAWDIQVLLTDRIGSTTYNLSLNVGTPILFVDRQKYSVGINCLPQNSNTLEINGKSILDLTYPVGSIYISVNNVNPGTLFGGTWVAFATGRTLVGVDTSQTEFNSVEKTGGKKDVRLSASIGAVNNGTTSIGYIAESPNAYQGISSPGYIVAGTNWNFDHWNHSTPVTEFDSTNRDTSVLQPYITVYMWKRTS